MRKLASIKIDADLIEAIMKITGKETKRAAVEEALKIVIEQSKPIQVKVGNWERLRQLRGKLRWGWEDDPHRELDEMRTNKR
ncbi:MAG: type II toxin-antitoxin system VapB family antitoxin [Candidatus Poribacteria bacterium]|nr:type II toxin-antitoxin system VapB family antitoxin [Candidatus Poribacteria bacterium]